MKPKPRRQILRRALVLGCVLAVCQSVRLAVAHCPHHSGVTVGGGEAGDAPDGPPPTQPPDDEEGTTAGEPVYLFSGEFGTKVTDVHIPARGLPITVRRTYRSFSAYNSRFGYGWDLNVNMKIREMADENVLLLDGRNRKVQYTANQLLHNPSCEDELVGSEIPGWTEIVGTSWTRETGLGNHPAPYEGVAYFYPGSVAQAELAQIVDVSAYAAEIDAGAAIFWFEGYVVGAEVPDTDTGRIVVEYWAGDGTTLLDSFDSGEIGGSAVWQLITDSRAAPVDTRFVHVRLVGVRNNGTELNAYFDALSLRMDGRYTSPPGRYDSLVKNPDGTFTLTGKHQIRHEFDENGNLTAIIDRNGNSLTFAYDPAGLLPVNGPSDYFIEQTRGLVALEYKLITITDATGRQVVLNYNEDGLLSSITDFAGRAWTYAYDPDTNDLIAVTAPPTPEFPSGTTTTYAYANHRLTEITDSKGQTYLVNQYDGQGRVEQQDYAGSIITFSYDPDNQQTTVTDGRGVSTRTTYNDAGYPTEITLFTLGWRPNDPPSFTTIYEYNDDMERTRTVHPRGNEELMTYDDLGNLLSRTLVVAPGFSDPNLVTTYTYHPTFNFVQTVTDPRGNVTTYAYGPNNGNLLSVTQPEVGGETPIWQFTYNAFGQIDTATDPEGVVTRYEYDPATGYLTSVTRNFGGTPSETTSYVHDAVGNVTTVTDANGHATTFVYNDQDQPTQIVSPSPFNYITNYGYDANGNVIQIDRQMDGGDGFQTTTFTYTIKNELETVTDELGHVTSYAYDANGSPTSVTDAEFNATSHDYDERDLLWKITDALTYVTEFAYDHNGNFASLTDANTNTTTFAHDGFGRLETTTYPDASTEVHSYDPAGNLTQFLNRRTQAIAFVYDALNRRETKTPPDYGAITYTYDLVGRLETVTYDQGTIQHSYDALGRLTQVIDANNYTVGYKYDPVGNRSRLVSPNGYWVTYEYDALNRLATIRDPSPIDLDKDGDVDLDDFAAFAACMAGPNVTPPGGCDDADLDGEDDVDLADFMAFQAMFSATAPQVVQYTYDALSRRTTATNGNGTSTTYTYDDANRLLSLVNHVQPSDLSFAYTYDNVGNRLTMSVNGTDTHVYDYDATYQLTSVDYPDGFFQPDTTFNYDPLGNRTSVVDGGTTTYVPNNLNQYASVAGIGYGYDPDGNLTSNGTNTYTYDSQNRLATAITPGGSATYAYDAFGRRISKTVNGTTTSFAYDGAQVLAEYDGAGQILGRFIYGVGIDEPVRMDVATPPGGATFVGYTYHADRLGDVMCLTDSEGLSVEQYNYAVFGTPDGPSAVGNPYQFTGRRYDPESGLYYYRLRHYESGVGRFMSPDPIGYGAGDPGLYRYVTNNPVNWVDPYGLCPADSGPAMSEEDSQWEYFSGDLGAYRRRKIKEMSDLSFAEYLQLWQHRIAVWGGFYGGPGSQLLTIIGAIDPGDPRYEWEGPFL